MKKIVVGVFIVLLIVVALNFSACIFDDYFHTENSSISELCVTIVRQQESYTFDIYFNVDEDLYNNILSEVRSNLENDGFVIRGVYFEKYMVHEVKSYDDLKSRGACEIYVCAERYLKISYYDVNEAEYEGILPDKIFPNEALNLPQLSMTGNIFKGWSLSKNGTVLDENKLNYEYLITSSGEIDLYAVWEKAVYNVTFHLNGHGNENSNDTYQFGEIYTPYTPYENGYTFGGWYTDSACTNKFESDINMIGDIDLYAKWEENVYTITYNNTNGAENDNPGEYTISNDNIILKPLKKEGWTFIGWYSDSALKYPINTIETAELNDIEIYAKILPITLEYSVGKTEIKVTSKGEEFNAHATSAIGESVEIKVQTSNGGDLNAGTVSDIIIIATDESGNALQSEILENIRVYGTPTINMPNSHIITSTVNIGSLFTAEDSFGALLDVETEIQEGNINKDEKVRIKVLAQDICGNVAHTEYLFAIKDNISGNIVELYSASGLEDIVIVTDSDTMLSAVNIEGLVAWKSEDDVFYANAEGNVYREIDTDMRLYALTASNKYGYTIVSTASAFNSISGSGKYILSKDINCSGYSRKPVKFSGKLFGNGYTVSNLNIVPNTDNRNNAMFSENSGVISDLRFDSASVTLRKNFMEDYAAVIAAINKGTIENCFVNCEMNSSGNIKNTHSAIIGLIAAENEGIIRKCYAQGSIIDTFGDVTLSGLANDYAFPSYVGGILGYNERDAVIEECGSDVDINLSINVKATNNHSLALVPVYAGGVVGYMFIDDVLSNSYAMGDINISVSNGTGTSRKVSAYAGGLIGFGSAEKCYATGNMSVNISRGQNTTLASAGALIAYGSDKSFVDCCLALGDATASGSGKIYSGALIGYKYKDSDVITVSKSYYSGDSNLNSWVYGSNVIVDEMYKSEFYEGLSFDTEIWNIIDGILPQHNNYWNTAA